MISPLLQGLAVANTFGSFYHPPVQPEQIRRAAEPQVALLRLRGV
jgi:hypothetical protein